MMRVYAQRRAVSQGCGGGGDGCGCACTVVLAPLLLAKTLGRGGSVLQFFRTEAELTDPLDATRRPLLGRRALAAAACTSCTQLADPALRPLPPRPSQFLYTFVIARVLLLSTAQTLWLLVSIYPCFYIAACGKGVLGAIVSLRLVGPTEGVVAISVISTVTVFTTPIIWQHVIDTGYLPGLQVNHLLEVIAIVLMFWYFCSSFEHLVTASEVYLPSGKPVSTVPKAVSCVVELIVLVSLVVLWNSFSSVSFAALSLALISAIFTSVILATHSGVSQKHCRWLNRRTVFVSALLIGNHVPMMLGLWGETILDDDWWGGACLLVQLSLLAIYLHSASADLQMMIIND
eukprot:TRINITY_DN1856_c0_g1_i5.p1 TRINITY_DN1856_c0_g1~~TRINITY_DN1856_c0_g1_i5.p1  ORF type:complete len:346 (+),score=60.16 TRINITY_DN1856_c0_g1_i5:179-1216(+)